MLNHHYIQYVYTLSTEKVPLLYFPAREAHSVTHRQSEENHTVSLGRPWVFSVSAPCFATKNGENEESITSLRSAKGPLRKVVSPSLFMGV